jgi:hypothetical protein
MAQTKMAQTKSPFARINQMDGAQAARRKWWHIISALLTACGLASLLLVGMSRWTPLHAQDAAPTPTVPSTVVLPPVQMHIPLAFGESLQVSECPLTSTYRYETAPILGNARDPDDLPILDPDLNLLVRGYKRTTATLELIAINGPTDDDAPQLAHLFEPPRVPAFLDAHQVYAWDWNCCPGGILGAPIDDPEVTLIEMEATPGELLYAPHRNARIHHDFIAMVLYAEPFRLTFTYTRDDSPAQGYVVHVEDVCVDPALLELYRTMHRAGRHALPALRHSDPIGTAFGPSMMVAVRDTGSFMDPRSAKDWWQDTVRARLAAQAATPVTTQP